jgi:hypothetical protein
MGRIRLERSALWRSGLFIVLVASIALTAKSTFGATTECRPALGRPRRRVCIGTIGLIERAIDTAGICNQRVCKFAHTKSPRYRSRRRHQLCSNNLWQRHKKSIFKLVRPSTRTMSWMRRQDDGRQRGHTHDLIADCSTPWGCREFVIHPHALIHIRRDEPWFLAIDDFLGCGS